MPGFWGSVAMVCEPGTAFPMEVLSGHVDDVSGEWRNTYFPPIRTSVSGDWSQRRTTKPPIEEMVRFCGSVGGASRPAICLDASVYSEETPMLFSALTRKSY